MILFNNLMSCFCLFRSSSLQLSSNGVIKRLYRQALSARTSTGDPSFLHLDLQSVTPLLLVLGAGIVLSTSIFVVELFVHRLPALYDKHTINREWCKKLFTSANMRSVREASAIGTMTKQDVFPKMNNKNSRSEMIFSRSFHKKIHNGIVQEGKETLGLRSFGKQKCKEI